MRTGALTNVGCATNKRKRPIIYLEKFYPIANRTDFYKWVISTPNGLATDLNNKVMYFDSFEFERAKTVLKAIRKTYKY